MKYPDFKYYLQLALMHRLWALSVLQRIRNVPAMADSRQAQSVLTGKTAAISKTSVKYYSAASARVFDKSQSCYSMKHSNKTPTMSCDT